MLRITSPKAMIKALLLQRRRLKIAMMMWFLLGLRKRRRPKHKMTMRVILLRPRRSENLFLRENHKHYVILAPSRVCNIT
jgi:hypothetical protein